MQQKPVQQNKLNIKLRPASIEEAGLFYSQMEEDEDRSLGTVGHLRMDFGHGGQEFWSSWWKHNEDHFNTPEFREELQQIVDELRRSGPLKDLKTMRSYCDGHGGAIEDKGATCGYIADTEHYRYCLRCTPLPGHYQGYLYCYDLRQQRMAQKEAPVGRVTYASGEEQTFTDAQKYLDTVLRMKPDVAVEVINCLMTLHDYEVCHPAGSYEALGRFFLQYESGTPRDALPFIDLEQLGRRYEDLHPGLFIGGSYVIYPAKEPENPYTGHNLAELDDSDWSVRLKIASPEKPDGVWVRLPDYSMVNDDKADEVELALLDLKVDTIQDCTLLDARCILPEVEDLVSEYHELADLIYDGNDLGFMLDEQGQGMPHFNEKFHAALAYEKCTRLGAALDIAQNLRCYDFVPKEEVESFVGKHLESRGIEARHVSLLSECMDRESYGRYLLAQQGYRQHTASGSFIRRNQLDFCYERSQPPTPQAHFEMKL